MKEHCSIMLVDDDEDDQLIFLTALREISNTIECNVCNNAERGYEMLQQPAAGQPDCIFLDLNLPITDGFSFLKHIKSERKYSQIPVIIYSTSSRELDKVKAMELGAFQFMVKPTSFIDLKDQISVMLNSIAHS